MSTSLDKTSKVGILGAGTMGTGIAQIAATYGHSVVIYDTQDEALQKSGEHLTYILNRQVEKNRMKQDEVDAILGRITHSGKLGDLSGSGLVIEAIIEQLDAKKSILKDAESILTDDAILATNTSSLSIAALSSALKKPERFLGTHFFNPAPLMSLVEIVPGIPTSPDTVKTIRKLIDEWGKTTVLAKDTPGFIVNRVARPFYGEALRILEEGIADAPTIDLAMKELGGFKMGPFELMDLIGNDINYAVTESVFEAFYYDPRFRPSFTQKRLVEAGYLGRKTGRGFYHYSDQISDPEPTRDDELWDTIFYRILCMLINEAADAVFMNIATPQDVDLAMTKGVNYPKGLLKWAEEIGLSVILGILEGLQDEYGEDRYRPNPLLRRLVDSNDSFFDHRSAQINTD